MRGGSTLAIVIKSEAERLVYGEVYAPLQIDTDNEAMLAEDVKKMAHNFLAEGRVNKIDVNHNLQLSGCLVVESFLARKSDPDGFLEGAWVLGVKVLPDDVWGLVLKGELNGFSFYGPVEKVQAQATVSVIRRIVGKTEPSADSLLPPHEHDLDIQFNAEGRVIPSLTGKSLGHTHPVMRTTATEESMEHSHRMVLIENEGEG
jgi:hypothetical protein